MTFKDTASQFGTVTRFFHWLIVILMAAMLTIGFTMTRIEPSMLQANLFFVHKSLGMCVAMIAVLWIIWRLINVRPGLGQLSKWQRIAAHSAHGFLFLALLLLPITGVIMSSAYGRPPSFFGLWHLRLPIPKDQTLADFFDRFHILLVWITVVLLTLHILAALKHHFLDKDGILKRMLPYQAPQPDSERRNYLKDIS